MDLTSEVPAAKPLPAKPALSDVLATDLDNLAALQKLRAEVVGWRQWWADQAKAWAEK